MVRRILTTIHLSQHNGFTGRNRRRIHTVLSFLFFGLSSKNHSFSVHLPLSTARLFRYFFSIITLAQGTEQEEEGRSGKGTTHKRATAGKTGEEGKEGDRKKRTIWRSP
jgi:hypothetical protein